MTPLLSQESEPESETGINITPSDSLSEVRDLDLPIALRKGVQSCTNILFQLLRFHMALKKL